MNEPTSISEDEQEAEHNHRSSVRSLTPRHVRAQTEIYTVTSSLSGGGASGTGIHSRRSNSINTPSVMFESKYDLHMTALSTPDRLSSQVMRNAWSNQTNGAAGGSGGGESLVVEEGDAPVQTKDVWLSTDAVGEDASSWLSHSLNEQKSRVVISGLDSGGQPISESEIRDWFRGVPIILSLFF